MGRSKSARNRGAARAFRADLRRCGGAQRGKVATASHDRTARIWDVRSGQPLLVLSGHSRYIAASAFSPDGTRIATASHDHTAKLWKWPSGEPVATLIGHEHVIHGVAFSSDGMRIATASSDGTVRVWDGQSGRRLAP